MNISLHQAAQQNPPHSLRKSTESVYMGPTNLEDM